MAKQLTAQPTLLTLIDEIQVLSPTKIKMLDIASDLGISIGRLSHILQQEEAGEVIPAKHYPRLRNKYKHLFKAVESKVELSDIISKLVEEVMALRSFKKVSLSILESELPKTRYRAVMRTMQEDEAQQLAIWKETGTFSS